MNCSSALAAGHNPMAPVSLGVRPSGTPPRPTGRRGQSPRRAACARPWPRPASPAFHTSSRQAGGEIVRLVPGQLQAAIASGRCVSPEPGADGCEEVGAEPDSVAERPFVRVAQDPSAG